MNLADVIETHPEDRVAVVDGDVTVTYGELRSRVAAVRQRLAAGGLGIGDRLAVMAGNELDFVVAVLAGLGIGAAVVPVRPNSPAPELRRKLDAVSPDLVILGEAGRWVVDEGLDIELPMVDLRHDEVVTDPPPIVDRAPDDTAFLMLTSGVASDSKIAVLSHGNLDFAQRVVTEAGPDGLIADDVTLGVLPFTHIFGLNLVFLATLRAGAVLVLQRRFDAVRSLELIRDHGITSVAGAPPMWRQILDADAPDDALSSVRNASSGAAALPREVFDGIKDRFGVEIGEGYGLTETSPIVTWSRGMPVRPGSVGRVVPGVDVVLAESDGSPVEPGDTGEIVVRGPGVFQGYLDSPGLTEAVLTPDGWFWTGDVGAFDDDGYLYVVDRVKDLIIVSGFNVYPAEVESVLVEHPGVRGAVVVGAADHDTGETVIAHVLGAVSVEELDAHARANLSRYKCPTEYRFVDELPMLAATGKPIRRELR